MKILFIHGWHSILTNLAEHGHQVINPALPDDDFDESVRIAQAEFDKHQPQVVVGSSRGGAVAMNIKCGRLVLLCQAWRKFEHRDWVVVHGTVLSVKLGKPPSASGATWWSISPCRWAHE